MSSSTSLKEVTIYRYVYLHAQGQYKIFLPFTAFSKTSINVIQMVGFEMHSVWVVYTKKTWSTFSEFRSIFMGTTEVRLELKTPILRKQMIPIRLVDWDSLLGTLLETKYNSHKRLFTYGQISYDQGKERFCDKCVL